MKDAFYFPHDTNAHSDPKMMMLISSLGLEGVGLYWILIELMHQEPTGKITKRAFQDYIKFFTQNKSLKELNEIQQVFNTTKLFVEQDGFICSNRVLENKKIRQEISEKRSLAGKKSAEKRAKQSQKATSVEQNLTSVEQGKERKGKENNTAPKGAMAISFGKEKHTI